MTAGFERSRKSAGKTFRLLKSLAPVNGFEAEASSFIQISQKLSGLFVQPQENVQDFHTGQF